MSFSAQLRVSNNVEQEIYKKVISIYAEFYFELKKNSDFSGLKNFIFADNENYPVVLREFNPKLIPSNGKVVGVAMHQTSSEEKLEHSLFYNIDKISGLILLDDVNINLFNIDENEKKVQIEHALNITFHELGHVHFNNRLLAFDSKLVLEKDFDTRNIYTRFQHSTKKACINEYLACIYASSSIGVDQIETYKSLYNNVLIFAEDCPNAVRKAFQNFYISKNFGVLMNEIYTSIAFLFKQVAYFLGHIHGLSQKLSDTTLYKKLKDSCFIKPLLELEKILSNSYMNIQSGQFIDSDLDDVSILLDNLANYFGISAIPTKAHDNVFIKIL